ncbi:helix-turn-helix domain-containing protein [Shewanella sp. KX20019]|uniref:helix-turn-helix domain-containing protein n=1 Tax=Shewanella sp. KX20019 TaxID=2803864 RepID=UPI001928FF4B|nr:helix-turn-helix domain-containing protein [Shewanella sp. KX20019]QQX81089.1 helix-turn-helix domain-containing protein [Shewanella sp. KX20019]
MFIGPVRFDIELKQLVNPETAQTLKLSNIEFLVMSDLMSSRGQVVSTESLCCKLMPQVVTAQDIALAITNIRAFLGADATTMIEVITNQGYLLHTKAKAQMHNSPYEALSIKQFSLFLLLGILLVAFLATHFKTTPNIHFSIPEQILLDGKKSVLVPIYSSDIELADFGDKFRSMAVLIDSCDTIVWQKIYAASSQKGDVLHFILHSTDAVGDEFTGFKVINVDENWDFLTNAWLKEVGFCE